VASGGRLRRRRHPRAALRQASAPLPRRADKGCRPDRPSATTPGSAIRRTPHSATDSAAAARRPGHAPIAARPAVWSPARQSTASAPALIRADRAGALRRRGGWAGSPASDRHERGRRRERAGRPVRAAGPGGGATRLRRLDATFGWKWMQEHARIFLPSVVEISRFFVTNATSWARSCNEDHVGSIGRPHRQRP
jgi:hypothetical protein